MPERNHGGPRPPGPPRPEPQPDELDFPSRSQRKQHEAICSAAGRIDEALSYDPNSPEGRELGRLYDQLKRVESTLLKKWGLGTPEDQQPEKTRSPVGANDREPKVSRHQAEKDPEKPEFWPVVRVVDVLQTGAIVKVERSHTNQTDAELYSFKEERRATLNHPLAHEWDQGNKLVVAESEMSPKLKKLVEERRQYELEYGRPEQSREMTRDPVPPPQTLGELSAPAEGRSLRPGAEVWSKRLDENTRASLFERVDEYGEKHSSIFITQAVQQPNGTTREVTTELDRKGLLAHHARLTNEREREPKSQQSLELGVWFGYRKKPTAGEEVTINKQQGIEPSQNRIDPLGYNSPYRPDGPPRYVVCAPTEKPGIYRVVGHTLDRKLAETTMRKMAVARERDGNLKESAVLERLANLVARHEPNDIQLKAGLSHLVKILAANQRNGHSQPQHPNGQLPRQGEDDASRHARGRLH